MFEKFKPFRRAAHLGVALATALGASMYAAPPQLALAATWNLGNVFLGVASGTYQVRDQNTGALIDSVSTSSGFTTGCAFDSSANFYGTWFTTNQVNKFDGSDPHTVSSFGSGFSTPESIVFDAAGHVFVGNLGAGIREFDSSGTFIKTVINTNVDWFDIAADQDTILYTQEGTDIKRVSISTGMSLPNFATGTASRAFALRILPDGGVLLANNVNVQRYNALGVVTQTYNAMGEGTWFSLNLDPNGTSFWAGDYGTSNFYEFDIASGTQQHKFTTGTPSNTLFGICLKGELTAALSVITLSPLTSTNPTGASHTVTATVTTNGKPAPGVVVTFSVTMGPDMGATGTCSASTMCVTDANGQVSFTYTNNGTAGTDTIQGCITGSTGNQICATATKTWMGDAPISATGTTFSATEGQPQTATVATVKDGDPNDMAVEYKATIDWGDMTAPSVVPLSGPNGGPYSVSGTHTYAEEGTYTVAVHVTDSDSSNTADATSTANVADAPLTSTCPTPATATAPASTAPPVSTQTFVGSTAKFNDSSTTGTPSDFTATINWGDSTSSGGTIAGGPGIVPYAVSGSHTYSSTGTFTVTTTINDIGGSMTAVKCQLIVFAFPTSNGATFVIGDLAPTGTRNPLPGDSVTWWSSQWAQLNPMTGGPPPASMKGFSGFEDNALGLPPACGPGQQWTTDPGNSTPPPATVPDVMGIIVSSQVTQNGSVISGDIKELVVVRNDPGYAPDPGHQGTGTILAIVCIS